MIHCDSSFIEFSVVEHSSMHRLLVASCKLQSPEISQIDRKMIGIRKPIATQTTSQYNIVEL